ncbi:Uncharacterized protein OS=Rhodopirellula maiorica SM1 GN=RMSM_02710 PE=4 SV=1 [Gemmata massiliana]|uniref:Uncharacterized protein n=1 Tax=Gemmata massiliana TaxID=1210884 RepID=A0A6P2DHR3_9BACT|nr:Uncharacterized protein OS=Rhodopirellula maiorica SM1 GN=RMSM_02710 PE=4 SV=1 [Gemmata massiliana]
MNINTIEYIEQSDFPASAQGRYARWRHKESWWSPGEPLWRVGCILFEKPLAKLFPGWDYCECVECGPSGAPILIGWCNPASGTCPWLPRGWPAGLFPLGISREHLIGWRGIVLAAVSYEPDPAYDYAPKVRWAYHREDIARQDWECGWLPLVRATRLLAHHYRLISTDRLLAPYPAGKHLARPDVEPLLDGLVQFGRGNLFPTGELSVVSVPHVSTSSASSSKDRERPVWDKTARALRFGDFVCKRFKRPAPSQEVLLDVFQEEGWPDAIDNPFPPSKGTRKLDNAIDSLNNRLEHIRFHLNGSNTGAYWEPV